ncbi:MAG: PorT family protein [Bacteroidales bacterium]|nr:PorT family protein [Bacteroidales bacterium]
MKRHVVIAILLLTVALPRLRADDSEWIYTGRLGFSIGGTAPMGMPATIRELNSFKLKASFSVGFDIGRRLSDAWGFLTGLRAEGKDMDIDATVKSYYTTIVQGGQSLAGNFTGRVVTRVTQRMFTIPVNVTRRMSDRLTLQAGPYVSILTRAKFEGYVYDGYLRRGDPTGPKVIIGSDENTRGSYDFGDDMRRLQLGLAFGADWHLRKTWGCFANLAWGITGIHKRGFKAIEQTLYPVYGTVGIFGRIR